MWTLAQQFNPRDLMLAAGVILILLAVMSRLRKRRAARHGAPSVREQIEQDRQLRGVRGDLSEVMVQVEELARDFSAKLDAKTIALEQLLREADAKIRELRSLQQNGPADRAPSSSPAAPPRADPPADPLARSVYALADEGRSPAQIAAKLDEHIGKVELILALRQTS